MNTNAVRQQTMVDIGWTNCTVHLGKGFELVHFITEGNRTDWNKMIGLDLI